MHDLWGIWALPCDETDLLSAVVICDFAGEYISEKFAYLRAKDLAARDDDSRANVINVTKAHLLSQDF
jgi:hypothetical protein